MELGQLKFIDYSEDLEIEIKLTGLAVVQEDVHQVGDTRNLEEVDLLAHGALPQVGLEDGHPGAVIRERNVYQLIQTTGPGGKHYEPIRV